MSTKPAVAAKDLGAPPRAARHALWIMLGLGAAARLAQYLHGRELWLDEAYLAEDVLTKSDGELTGELSYNMVFPLGFLFLERFCAVVFGPWEYALRVPALVAGLAALPAFAWMCAGVKNDAGSADEHTPNPWTALLAAALFFALSKHLVYYASEMRQYALDVLIVCLVYALTLPEIQARQTAYAGQCRRLLAASALGAAALWLALAPVFVLASVALVYALQDLRARAWRALTATALIACVWGLSFAAHLFWLRRIMALGARTEAIRNHVAAMTPPLPPHSAGDLARIWEFFTHFFAFPGGFSGWMLPVFAAAMGVLVLCRRRWAVAAALTAPALLVLIAAALRQYPARNQYLLFLLPGLFLVMGWGAAHFLSGRDWLQRTAGRLLLLLLLLHPAAETARTFGAYRSGPGGDCVLRPVIAHVEGAWRDGDVVVVREALWPLFAYAGPRAGFARCAFAPGAVLPALCEDPGSRAYIWAGPPSDTAVFAQYAAPNRVVPAPGRVWLVDWPAHGPPASPGAVLSEQGLAATPTARLDLYVAAAP